MGHTAVTVRLMPELLTLPKKQGKLQWGEYQLISMIEDGVSQAGDFSRRTSYYGGMFPLFSCLPVFHDQLLILFFFFYHLQVQAALRPGTTIKTTTAANPHPDQTAS